MQDKRIHKMTCQVAMLLCRQRKRGCFNQVQLYATCCRFADAQRSPQVHVQQSCEMWLESDITDRKDMYLSFYVAHITVGQLLLAILSVTQSGDWLSSAQHCAPSMTFSNCQYWVDKAWMSSACSVLLLGWDRDSLHADACEIVAI